MTKLDINTKRRRAKQGEARALVKQVAETPEEDLPDECILWPFSLANGYGQVSINRKHNSANRWVWVFRYGEPENGLVVRHKCKNKACFNPKHLELGTYADNNGPDKVRDGTAPRGSNNYSAVMTEETALKAYNMRKQGIPVQEIANIIGATKPAVESLCLGRTWKHLKLPRLDRRTYAVRPCKVNGVRYSSCHRAGVELGVTRDFIRDKCRSPNFPDYYFCED